jgi:hypothetical protein
MLCVVRYNVGEILCVVRYNIGELLRNFTRRFGQSDMQSPTPSEFMGKDSYVDNSEFPRLVK